MRAAPYCPGNTPPWYGRLPPAESTRYTIGMRWRIATSCARRIFLMVSGHHEPALTVASFATTTAGRPATRPSPVTTPAAGAWPSYASYATRSPISNQGPSGSRSAATRSRAVSLPCSCWRRTRSAPPPCSSRALSARYSSVRVWRRPVRVSELGGDMVGRPFFDVLHQVAGRRTGPEQLADPAPLERLHILGRNDAASGDQDVAAARVGEELFHAREQRHVGARENGEPHDIHVFLDRRLGDHFGRLVQARVHDFHAGIAQRRRHDLGSPVVSIQSGLRHQDPDGSLPGGHPQKNTGSR